MAISDLLHDLRYTFRTLRRDAGFATFAILIAGLGIGASVTVFSVVNALILRPLPFADPGQLVWVANRDTSGLSGQTTQVGHMLDLRERTRTLSAIAGYFAFYGVGDNLLSGTGEGRPGFTLAVPPGNGVVPPATSVGTVEAPWALTVLQVTLPLAACGPVALALLTVL